MTEIILIPEKNIYEANNYIYSVNGDIV